LVLLGCVGVTLILIWMLHVKTRDLLILQHILDTRVEIVNSILGLTVDVSCIRNVVDFSRYWFCKALSIVVGAGRALCKFKKRC
jgi:hypothetical protein